MEVVLALVLFAVVVLSWFVLPGGASVALEEVPAWSNADALQVAPAEA